ncbi:hypothetical protein H2201_001226 [Coniosporium apollinis]|uniref:tRNA (guanine(10)-N(2))-methyltransferase n=1 Tax=Coniosporium apollinis TaxID=61459 RepID=A0ABQ9P4V8_9PEZI|nr:hypothetical protein H2201_001226 [Coniosporium apollinis]
MEYLVRLIQIHETFRKPELEALAILAGMNLEILHYNDSSPFCIIRLPSPAAARALITRSILSAGIYELWGSGTDYTTLHASVRARTAALWPAYKTVSFRFTLDGFQGKRSTATQRALIESFSYMDFDGPIRMNGAELELCVFEEYALRAPGAPVEEPRQLYLGRFIAASGRAAVTKYDLKKRAYISTTSMDAELALVTANLALAAPGKLMYDPFVGTGGFPIACAHFGVTALGSDIDGRSIRGKNGKGVISNFVQYGLLGNYGDCFVADLTNTPLRKGRLLDGIVCDPPYGVREGLKVLGNKDGRGMEAVYVDGKLAHLPKGSTLTSVSPGDKRQDGFIPPKRPYSFEAMLDDILEFASVMLVDGARLSMWMPTANDEDIELAIPTHPYLEIVSVCVQAFNKWSRRLLTYRRIPDSEVDGTAVQQRRKYGSGIHANDLNSFRRKYFEGFKVPNGDTQSNGAVLP